MQQLFPTSREVAAADLLDLYDLPGPHLRADFVTSTDGVVAVDGTSDPLGTPADKAVFRVLRAVSDAVIVGAGTARIARSASERLALRPRRTGRDFRGPAN